MKDDPKFNISFVQTVEKYEVLYNFSLKDYFDKEKQERAWSSIAKEVNESVSACKNRWKNLRASLCRHLRNVSQPCGPGAAVMSKKPYYLADYMQFVIPYTKTRPHNGNALQTSEETDYEFPVDQYNAAESPDVARATQTFCQSPEVQPSPESTGSILRTENTVSWQDQEERQFDALENCTVEYYCPKKPKLVEAETEDDSDLLFLKSLLPDMKQMDGRQKNRFKRKVLVAIEHILYKSARDETPILGTPSPS